MRKRPHWAGEILVIVGLLVVYDYVAGLAKVHREAAFAHGADLLALTPGGIEKSANHWLAGVTWLQDPSAYYYDLAHIDVTLGVFLLCYGIGSPAFRRARTSLVLINVAALVVFLAYPVAPPRLLPGAGFVDIVADSGTWGAWEAGGAVADHANQFGSMPSLHLAWAVWVALTVMGMTRGPVWRAIAWAHVAVTSLVVVYTGNHYLIDLVAGAALAVAAWAVAPRLPFTASSQRTGRLADTA